MAIQLYNGNLHVYRELLFFCVRDAILFSAFPMGQVEIQDMEVNSVIEMILHIYSTIVIQLQTLPQM